MWNRVRADLSNGLACGLMFGIHEVENNSRRNRAAKSPVNERPICARCREELESLCICFLCLLYLCCCWSGASGHTTLPRRRSSNRRRCDVRNPLAQSAIFESGLGRFAEEESDENCE